MLLIILIEQLLACQFEFTPQESTNETKFDILRANFYAFGIWTRYYTFYQDLSNHISIVQNQTQILRGFNKQGRTQLLYTMSLGDHQLIINLQNGKQENIDFQLSYKDLKLEGVWIFLYIGFDYQGAWITSILVNTKTKQGLGKRIRARPSTIDSVVIFEQFNEKLDRLIIFSGQISFKQTQNTQVLFINKEQLLEYLESCPLQNYCASNSVNRIISGIMSTFQQPYQYTQKNSYWIDGWFLFNPLPTMEAYNNIILKIIQYNKESFQYNGMTPLEISLNFNRTNQENNKITAQTQSYNSPKWFDAPVKNVSLSINYQEEQIKSWVYFRYFQYDQSDSNAQFYVFFNNSDNFNKNIGNMNSFMHGQFYIYIGFSQLSPNRFIGQIANVNIQSCLQEYPIIKKACHYSCLTCSGPMDYHCLSCDDSNQINREYNYKSMICECILGYIAAEGELQCVNIQTAMKQSTLSQFQNSLLESQQCNYGQFQYKMENEVKCFNCPQQSSHGIQCADCIENMLTWQNYMNCSYDYYQIGNQTDAAFILYIRPESKKDFYYIQEELLLCEGCQLNEGDKQIVVKEKIFLDGECHESYYYYYSCHPCQLNCQICEDLTGLCTQCEFGYVLNNQICYSCPAYCQSCIYTNQIICTHCLQGFTPAFGICQQCEANCLHCQFDALYNIPRCLICKDTSYFLHLDGVNCFKNTILNCKTQYQTYGNINTLVYNFPPQLDKVDVVNKCALCESNYVNFGTYCEKSTDLKPDEQVLNINGQLIYLISSTSTQRIFKDCYEDYCNQCIPVGSYFKCIECFERYYANILNGKCDECPQQCLTCQQQNKNYQDGWKWNIRAYFKYSFPDIEFENVASSKDFNDYEVICLTCSDGYMLYKNTCILNCPANCKECQIINGQNVCTFCGSNNYGSLLTTIKNQCSNCPQNCEFCQPRQKNNVDKINPLFDPDDASKYYYSYLCLKPRIIQNIYIYYDKFLQQYVKCQNGQSCLKQLNIKLKAHCDQQSYDNEKKKYTSATMQDFHYENVLVQKIFSDTKNHFAEIETPQFLEYLNINQIMSLIYEITLISSSDSCSITNFTSTIVPKNVFSILSNKLVINGNNLILKSQFAQILNFSEVEIQSVKFDLPFYIKISHPTQLIVSFRNINYVSKSQSNDIDIILVNPQQIEIINFFIQAIEQLKTSQNNMISYNYTNSSTVTNLNIKMDNLQFTKSQFSNIDFLIINADAKILNTIINITNSVIEATFQNASFIKESQVTNYGQVNLFNVTFIVSLLQASLINLNGQLNFSGSVKLSANLTQSNFLRTNQFEILSSQVYNTYLYNSTIIDNKIKKQDNSINVLKINNLIFNQVFYDISSNFINIIDDNLEDSLIIQNVQTIDCQFMSKYIIKTSQRLIMFEGFNFSLLHSNFNKNIQGLTDLSIKNCQSVTIDNVTVRGWNVQGLQNKLDCYNTLVNVSLQNAFIYLENINSIELRNSQFNNIMIQNYPIIGIYCYDDSREYEIKLENLNFSNNLILITEFKSQASIFQLLASQQGNLKATNVQFIENVINEYQQNQFQNSATTFLIEAEEFNISLKNNLFNKNQLFNSSDSVLFIQAQQIIVQNSIFTKSNLYNDFILRFVMWGSTDQFYQENLQEIFPIISVGGNGRFVADTLLIDQCEFSQSTAQQGSGFHLTLQNRLEISNSTFIGLHNNLIQDDSQGGSIFINLIAYNATLKIHNTQFNNTYSLYDGGAIYINSRYTTSNINLTQIIVMNCYSIKGTFISAYLNKYSNLVMEKISIKNDLQAFQYYLGEIYNLTENNVEQFHQSSAIFFVQYGSLYISDCIITDITLSSLLYFYSASYLYIYNSVIQNVLFSQLGLIQLYPTSNADTITFIKNIQILNCNNIDPQQKLCQNEITTYLTDFQCFNLNTRPTSLSRHPKDTKAIINCFQQRLLDFTSSSSMIYINLVQVSDYFYLSDLQIRNNNCSFCTDGMITIKNVEIRNPEFNNIIFEKLYFSNNTCGSGCLVVAQQSVITFPYRRLLQSQLYQSRFTIQSTIILEQSEFFNNTAQKGMIIVSNLSLVVLDVKLIKNNGTDISGGILFLGNKNNTFNIMASELSNNTGNKGGAINLGNKLISSTQLLQVLLISNNATTFGQDIASSPQELTISLNGGKSFLQTRYITKKPEQVIQEIITKPYKIQGNDTLQQYITLPSGQKIKNYQYYHENQTRYIPYNLTLRVIALNSLRQQMIDLQNTNCNIQQRRINISSNSTGPFEGLLLPQIQFNTTSGDYNFDDLEINFDPYQSYDQVLQLQFKCSSIQIPILNSTPPYNILYQSNNYELWMNVRTFKCQRGEYYNESLGTCNLCDSKLQLYSVVIKATKCNGKDDDTMKSVNSTHIELKQYFWRPYDDNDIVTYCYNFPVNCKGGWSAGYSSCEEGHIGALCEQCDLYNVRGSGSYSLSGQFQCGSCSDISINTISIMIIILWSLITIFLSVKGTVESVDELVIRTRGTKAGFVCVYVERVQVAVLMKILTNYLQIISSLGTFQLKLPPGLRDMFAYSGRPVKSLVFSLDCFLVELSTISILYFRNIWSICMPFYYATIIFVIYFAIIKIKDMKLDITVISTTLIYIFILVQPDIIGGFISLLSYRNISHVLWVQGNVSYLYLTTQHRRWLLSFVCPVLIIFGFLIPLVLYMNMSKFKHKLEDTNVLRFYGYLYNEYSKVTYYWEILKICQKELIIIFLIFYEDIIIIKGTLVFIIIFCYDIFSKTYKPYKRVDLNELDSQSSFVCAFSIVLGMAAYFADQNGNIEILWPFFVLMGLFNFFFILKMITLLILGYVYKMTDQLDQIRDYINQNFPNFIINHPWVYKYLENSKVKSKRVKQWFLKLREYLWARAQQNREQTKNKKLETDPDQEIEQKELIRDLNNQELKKDPHISILGSISSNKSRSLCVQAFQEDNREKINMTIYSQKLSKDQQQENDNGQNQQMKQDIQSSESIPSEFEDNQEFDYQFNNSDLQKIQDNEEEESLQIQQ
ncbi:hypothetical protein pb186bvf_015652 [Paramecium bursaria]